jgi:hypothetical protein
VLVRAQDRVPALDLVRLAVPGRWCAHKLARHKLARHKLARHKIAGHDAG